MKLTSPNHLKLTLANSHHNLFHYLLTIFTRLLMNLFWWSMSLYLTALGFALATGTISQFLPFVWVEKVNFYSAKLPYFSAIKQSLFTWLGFWYQKAMIWWTIVVGFPLVAIGIGSFLTAFFNLYYSIFDPLYNHGHCPLCKTPLEVKSG